MANNIPSVSSPLPLDLQQFVQRVREALDGGGLDAVVTARQLIAAGLAASTSTGAFVPVGDTVDNPSPPTNLAASGAMANIILTWDAVSYRGHSFTEIWAHTGNNLGSAELVGMTAGNNFAHNIGGTATRYYWVRNINQNGLASGYNAVSGVQGTTSSSPNFLMELLAETYGTNSQSPFFQIDSATTINGVSIPAGTYMKDAFIHNASINNAKIANAAVDNAKIANLDAVKINAGFLNAARIQANTITADKINSNGLSIKDASGNVILAAGSALAVSNVSGLGAFATLGQISSSNAATFIASGAIQNAQIANAAIDNAKITGAIQSSAYSAGSAGWKIDKSGAAELNNATFRGTIDVASSSSSSTSRLEITNSTIKVFEGSTLRVKIGDLS